MKKKKWVIWITVPLVMVLLFGLFSVYWVSASFNRIGMAEYIESDSAYRADYAAAPESSSMMKGASTADTVTAALPENRKWVITASISAETNDLDSAMNAITWRRFVTDWKITPLSYVCMTIR